VSIATEGQADKLRVNLEDLQQCHKYLDALEAAYDGDMYGAEGFLSLMCGLDDDTIRAILAAWMKVRRRIETGP